MNKGCLWLLLNPSARSQGKAEVFQNINLTCYSEDGNPTPTYRWPSFDFKNISRPNPPKSIDENGVLSLYDISMENTGYYVCTSTNKVGSQACIMTLDLKPYPINSWCVAGNIPSHVPDLSGV
ncbi:cell surface A33 antigen-like [Colossoma macropomum]|uniref:cell surface A33 antigen-like n=1 Tax=Colossoma macropomum TaxID=42526 RepID=UPI00186411C3|nr:cell surface A33 antigen-like [Colossoma macropomum]